MNFQPLVSHYVTQWQLEFAQAKELRQILQDATLDQSAARIESALNGEQVTRRGAQEWHVASPVERRGRTGDSVPAYYTSVPAYTTIAADGSQVMPDSRHRYPWAMIRVAAFAIFCGGQPVDAHRSERLVGPDDERILAILAGDMTREERNAAIGGLRDDLELDMLVAETVAMEGKGTAPVLAMVDGPLHIYRPDIDGIGAALLGASLHRMTQTGALPIGLVDGGHARYTVRLAALLANQDEKTWPAVSDFDVWGHLPSGERSPLFTLHSICNQQIIEAGHVPVNFFYLRTGERVVRVETPASSAADLALITAILTQDSQGDQPPFIGLEYPYALLKAHEGAVVAASEKRYLNEQFLAAMASYGMTEGMSAKETLKAI